MKRIGSQKQLFVDENIIERMESVSQVLNPVKKHPQNPVLKAEKPWEQRLPYVYGTVVYDEEEQIFKMWYQIWSGRRGSPQWKICYATSPDGICWERPNLGLIECDGSKENNIVATYHIPSVIYSPEEPNPERRYKMFYYMKGGYGVSFSADGIHWSDHPKNPILAGGDVAPTIYDELSGRYVSFTKLPAQVGEFRRRSVGISFSEDFVHWTTSQLVLPPDEVDDEMAENRIAAVSKILEFDEPSLHRAEFYGMGCMPYEDMYLGLLWVFDASANTPAGNQDGPIEVQLTSSRDLIHWQRAGGRKPLIPLGEIGEWDCGMIFTVNRPIIVDDEIWIYYGGQNSTHGCQLFWDQEAEMPGKQSGIGLATLRLDGFVSVDAGEREGTLTTKPLSFQGNKLVINARTERGSVWVEMLDEENNSVAGFSRDDCDAFIGDELRHVVSWRGRSEVSSLAGRTIRLKFYLRNAKLYSFEFQP